MYVYKSGFNVFMADILQRKRSKTDTFICGSSIDKL